MSKVEMRLDMAGLSEMVRELDAEMKAAARPAARAAALVFYEEVRRNVRNLGVVTGNLYDAIYHAYTEAESGDGLATYTVSWNHTKAPHGHLVEFGHIQRYAVRMAENGQWYTLVRPSQRGKRRPSRRASQATLDAYYVPRAGGPRQVGPFPFVRPALAKANIAMQAAETRFLQKINEGQQ